MMTFVISEKKSLATLFYHLLNSDKQEWIFQSECWTLPCIATELPRKTPCTVLIRDFFSCLLFFLFIHLASLSFQTNSNQKVIISETRITFTRWWRQLVWLFTKLVSKLAARGMRLTMTNAKNKGDKTNGCCMLLHCQKGHAHMRPFFLLDINVLIYIDA